MAHTHALGHIHDCVMTDNTSMIDVLSKARYGRLQQHGRQVAARCEIWRVVGAARRDIHERCCDSTANTPATAARVLKGMFDRLKDKHALEPGGCQSPPTL